MTNNEKIKAICLFYNTGVANMTLGSVCGYRIFISLDGSLLTFNGLDKVKPTESEQKLIDKLVDDKYDSIFSAKTPEDRLNVLKNYIKFIENAHESDIDYASGKANELINEIYTALTESVTNAI